MITRKRLKEVLRYDLLTGDFIWKINKSNRAPKGAVAGGILTTHASKKYRIIGIDGVIYRAHRLAFLYVLSAFPENGVDHINGDGLDNSWINLRPATSRENGKNMRLPVDNKSGHIGVGWVKDRKKWGAQINNNTKHINLGLFANLEDAIKARKAAEKKYGFHENHGTRRPL